MVQTWSVTRRLAGQAVVDGHPSSLGNPSTSHAAGPDLPFNFLALPIEIRYMVYTIMFVGRTSHRSHPSRRMETEHPPMASSERAEKTWPYPRLSYQYFNFLRTCRQVSTEATTILYGRNMFVFGKEHPSDTKDLWPERSLAGIGVGNCQRLRHVHFRFATSHSTSVINDLNSYWKATLATLWAYCQLSTLTMDLIYWRSSLSSYRLDIRYIFEHGSNDGVPRQACDEPVQAMEPRRGMDFRSLKQVKLELSASVKAFEMSHCLELPEENEDPI